MPGVAFHRELDNALGTVKYTPLLGEECLVAVVAEALRIGQGKSHLSPDPLPGESIFSSEVNRFWHYVFDVDMLDGTLEEAKLAAEAIEKARR